MSCHIQSLSLSLLNSQIKSLECIAFRQNFDHLFMKNGLWIKSYLFLKQCLSPYAPIVINVE